MTQRLAVCVMGASTDTGNLGVSALCLSILAGLAEREPGAEVVVFDNGRGAGAATEVVDGHPFALRRSGLNDSRRFYRSDCLWNVRMSSRLGGAGNPAAIALRRADAVLDVTGGGSFTDLYGPRRFWSGAAAKRLALRHSGGLVLMPQTYGPFRDEAIRREAAELVAASAAAWSRDAASHLELERLLGRAFNPASHRCGVDVAFSLRAEPPSRPLPPDLASWLDDAGDGPLVGLNVSGLTWNRADAARREYALTADYRAAVRKLLGRFITRSNARVVIVPHVLTPPGHFECDVSAAEEAVAGFSRAARRRILIAPALSATEAKWLIARTSWFCATRMHSAIAALSSGVPAAAFAYSCKTRGVFETCGVGEHVADLRTYSAVGAVDAVWRSFESRDDVRARLAAELPRVLATAEEQMDSIVLVCRSLAASRTFDSEYATV